MFMKGNSICSEIPLLELHQIELEGFKSFKEKTVVGPFTRFTCVVGPNGCGKSVLGEAIAFALGGNKSMLRAKALSALINQDRVKQGNKTAIVTLKLKCSSKPAHSNEIISIRRELHGGRSVSKIKAADNGHWKTVTQDELRAEMSIFGIQTQVVDRYIVTQNRQAIDVHCPIALLRYLEMLIGNGDFEERLKEIQDQIRGESAKASETHEQISRLNDKREALAPTVRKWEEFSAAMKMFETRKTALLKMQSKTLTNKIARKERKVVTYSRNVENLTTKSGDILENIQNLESDHLSADTEQRTFRKEEIQLRKKVEGLEIEEAKLETQIQSTEEIVKAHTAKQNRVKKTTKALDEQRTSLVCELEEIVSSIENLACMEKKNAAAIKSLRSELEAKGRLGQRERAKIRKAERNIEVLQSRISDIEFRSAKRESEARKWERKIQTVNDDLQKLRQQKTSHKEVAAQQESYVVIARKEVEVLREDVRVKEIELDDLRQALSSKQVEIEVSRQNLETLQSDQLQCGGGNLLFDRAIYDLDQVLSTRNGPKNFYGRLNNIGRLSDVSASTAVNSVLQELINLSSCLVVRDRPTAQRVITHFTENKLGLVTCKIVSEMEKKRPRERVGKGMGVPLTTLVEVAAGFEETSVVFENLFDGWVLVEEKKDALRLIHSDKGRMGCNTVTRKGELFKCDGEVVGCSISNLQRLPGVLGRDVQPIRKCKRKATDHQQSKELKESMNKLQKKIVEFQHESVAVESKVRQCQKDLKLKRAKLQRAGQRLAKLAADEETMKREVRRQLERSCAAERELEIRLDDAASRLEALKSEELDADKIDELRNDLQKAQDERDNLRIELEGGRALTDAEHQQRNLRLQLKELGKRKSAVNGHVKRLECKLAAKAKDLETEKQRLNELGELKARKQGVCLQKEEAGKKLGNVRCLHQDARQRVDVLSNELQKQCKEKDALICELEEAKAQLICTSREIDECKDTLKKVANVLEEIASRHSGGAKNCSEENESSSKGDQPNLTLARNVRWKCDDPDDTGDSDFDDDRDGSHGSVDDSMDLEAQASALAREESRLERLRCTIDFEALEEDLKTLKSLKHAENRASELERSLEAKSDAVKRMQRERYEKFIDAMKRVNSKLSEIYQFMTGNQGDAYCSFTEDMSMLFIEGITFNVRPDRNRWQPFCSLSGGQKSLATLALSFSLQSAFPSPFYYFDEIDAALDTMNASKVAEYIKMQNSAQYLVVSHKPQVFEQADCLVGIYSVQGNSGAVTLNVKGNAHSQHAL